MTALPQDVVAELKTRIAELEQGLQASAAENERLEHELFLSRDRQTATAEVLQVISRSAFDLDAVLQTLVEIAGKLCRADAAQIYRREGELYRSAAMCGNVNETYRAIEEAGAISAGPGTLIGRVALEGRPVQIADAWNDPGYGASEDARIGNLRSMLGLPLIRNGDQIGAFALARDHVEDFSDGEIELVRTFADQAVIAIENARLFREVQQRTDDLGESLQQQTATADVLKVISRSAFDLETVLNTLTESAARLCDADMAAITRQQADGGYAHATRYNFAPEWERVSSAIRLYPGRGSLVGRVLLEGKAVQITDVLADPEYVFHEQQRAGGYRTLLGVPLVREGQPTGVLFLGRATVKPFSNRQIELVQTFADQAVIAIENVRLFDEVQAKTRDLSEALQQQTATAEVLKVISRSTFDLPAVLHALVETAARLCGADKGTITRQKDGAFYRAESYGFSEAFMDFVRGVPVIVDRHSATGRALLESVVVHIPDVEADREYTFREGQRLGDFRSLLGVPMLREGLPIGVITLTRTEPGGFTDKQIELAMTFADQAAIAIGNVQLFDAVQTRTRELAQSLEDLRTAQDRLVQTEKLASLGQLTAGIAHEIKNPLNFVNNFAALSAELTGELDDALASSTLPDKTRAEIDELTGLLKNNLQKVVQHGKRADSIVKNMLLHSREGFGEHRLSDINALVEESLNLAYHGARAEKPQFDVMLKRELDPAAGSADVLPQEITRVLLNLVSNGFYAVARRKSDSGAVDYEPIVMAATRDRGDSVEIRIRDNGTGIPAEVMGKMFNPFFTTKSAGEGTGLGLSMSHDIVVKQHGGTIDVATKTGEFSEFTIVLPRKSRLPDSSRG